MRLGSFWVTRWRMSSDFAAFDRCRDALYARLLSGSPLEQLVSAPEFAA